MSKSGIRIGDRSKRERVSYLRKNDAQNITGKVTIL